MGGENPYWQYFCGGEFFEHRRPIRPTLMSRCRGHLQEAGAEKRLAELIAVGLRGQQLAEWWARARRLLVRPPHGQHKLYSVDAPGVEGLAKGKAHKLYEFGCKVSLASSSRGNWIVGARALHANPCDGHTLGAALAQVQWISGQKLRLGLWMVHAASLWR